MADHFTPPDLRDQIKDLTRRIAELERRTSRGDDWHLVGDVGEPAFTNGWVNFDVLPGRRARYRVEGRRCFLDGLIKSGTVGQAAFQLPFTLDLANAEDYGVSSNGAFAIVVMSPSGLVIPASNNTAVFLNQISVPLA